ncbi:MAG: serine acetyltransferase [Desulfovibrionaceae bacterium]|nr:serine acetyltransferase [Desulfovibrionaceae bacterium]
MSEINAPYASCIPEIDTVVQKLCQTESLSKVWREASSGSSMPSLHVLKEIMERLRAIIFPGYFGSSVSSRSVRYHLAANLDSVYHLLREQIARGLAFADAFPADLAKQKREADAASLALLDRLPEIRDLLAEDAQAGYEGDPAATSPGETIFCYPSMYAMFHHRIAHELYELKIPLIPRIISEMSHSRTGIDIHPGATIGKNFFIDHGTGVVIGETTIVGDSCRLYQGVTLGAVSFPKNPDGTLTKGNPRHPVLGNHVTVYAGATILGRIFIGDNAVIGGNVWVIHDIPAGAHIVQGRSDA